VRELWKPVLKLLAWLAAGAFIIGVILRLTVIEIMVVGHNGMAPTVEAGETVLLWKGTDYDVGSIAVCRNPENDLDLVMGRVVGLPLSHVESHRGELQIDGHRLDVDWTGTLEFRDSLQDRTDTVNLGIEQLGNHEHGIFHRAQHREFAIRDYDVEEGRLYLLGDNRYHADDDSRNFGTVVQEDCMGYVFFRVSPPEIPINDLGHGYLDILR
jgi:signal peptidase I